MLSGHATPEGTGRFASRFPTLPAGHFRDVQGLRASSLGLGTYLGEPDDATDDATVRAVRAVLAAGANVLDAAINYRNMRSERAIGRALTQLVSDGEIRRDEVIVSTKGGFLPFDGDRPADSQRYIADAYFATGLVEPEEIVSGCHCMTPRFLQDQIDRSRKNLGLETIDVYYLHNPETQLERVRSEVFYARVRRAFGALEQAVASGKIRTYGVATWSCLRVPEGSRDHVSLERLSKIAEDVAAPAAHHFGFVQLPFNIAMPEALTLSCQSVASESGPALLAARALGLSTMASVPLLQAKLTRGLPPLVHEVFATCRTDAQRAIQFVRSAPALDVAVVGMKRPEHLEENLSLCGVAPAAHEDFMKLFRG
ncbi:MAG: aldo/keto reductase [Deltaproteobacteria bacterium]|nr:aldo/keto reductase [Deltaproteobacteria bacterium]